MNPALLNTELPFPKRTGKVRDVYDLGDSLLIVATDRVSAFDVIMPTGIPDKGRILTALSLFWFDFLADEFDNHLLATEVNQVPASLRPHVEPLAGRFMLVQKAEVIPIECVARGYLAGSGWKEYQQSQTVCGIKLPPALPQCAKLPEPIFTPATKEQHGHDVNISFDAAAARIGKDVADELRRRTLAIYAKAAGYAAERGILIADTKFEFGTVDGEITLIDEVLTPDSSRFWPADRYAPGFDQPSFDKQFLRNWLERQGWNKQPPAPALPPDVAYGTYKRYAEAYEMLTGQKWA
jgi:phosphoribosylaminoimidazole-succinocarboxamide synthase